MRRFSSKKGAQTLIVLFALLIGCCSCLAEEQTSAVEQLRQSLELLEKQIDSAQNKLSEVQGILNQLKAEVRVPAELHIAPATPKVASNEPSVEGRPQASQVTGNQDANQAPEDKLNVASGIESTQAVDVSRLQQNLNQQPPVPPQQVGPEQQLTLQVTGASNSPGPYPGFADHANHPGNQQQQAQDESSNRASNWFEAGSETPTKHYQDGHSSSPWSSSQMTAAAVAQGVQNLEDQEYRLLKTVKSEGTDDEHENLSYPETRGTSAFDPSQIENKIRKVFEKQFEDLPQRTKRIKNSLTRASSRQLQSQPEPRQQHQGNGQQGHQPNTGERPHQSSQHHRGDQQPSSARRWLRERMQFSRLSEPNSANLQQTKDQQPTSLRRKLSGGTKRILSKPKRLLSRYRGRSGERDHSSISGRDHELVQLAGSNGFAHGVRDRGGQMAEAIKRQTHDLNGLVRHQGSKLSRGLARGVQTTKFRAHQGYNRARGMLRKGRQSEDGLKDGQPLKKRIFRRNGRVAQSSDHYLESRGNQHMRIQTLHHQQPLHQADEQTYHNHQLDDFESPIHDPNDHGPYDHDSLATEQRDDHEEDDYDEWAEDADADEFDDDEGFDGDADAEEFSRNNPDRTRLPIRQIEPPKQTADVPESLITVPYDRAVPDMLGRLPNVPPVAQSKSN